MSINKAQRELLEAIALATPPYGSTAPAALQAFPPEETQPRVEKLARAIDAMIVERIRAARSLPPLPAHDPETSETPPCT